TISAARLLPRRRQPIRSPPKCERIGALRARITPCHTYHCERYMTYTTLISAAELAEHIFDPNWVILDCRHDLANPAAGRNAYDEGHLPNAQFADLDGELAGSKTDAAGKFRGRHPLPERADFLDTLRRWGISDNTQVVTYDAHGGMFAARVWWMLRWAGLAGEWHVPVDRSVVAHYGHIERSAVTGCDRHGRRSGAESGRQETRGGRCARAGPFSRRERNTGPGRRSHSGREEPLLQGQPAGRRPLQAGSGIACDV